MKSVRLLIAPALPRLRRMRTALGATVAQLNFFTKPEKVLYIVRHGRTEMNEYLSVHRYDRRVRSRKKRKPR